MPHAFAAAIPSASVNVSGLIEGFALTVLCTCSSDLLTSIRTLVTCKYTAQNHDLAALDYGNGDSVKYIYDQQGRVTKQTYEDGSTVSYRFFCGKGNNLLSGPVSSISVRLVYNNKVTTYSYNENTGVLEWVRYPGDTAARLHLLQRPAHQHPDGYHNLILAGELTKAGRNFARMTFRQ